jgi:hypothetical protein
LLHAKGIMIQIEDHFSVGHPIDLNLKHDLVNLPRTQEESQLCLLLRMIY